MIKFKARAKAFTGRGVKLNDFAIDNNRLLVWDSVAGNYTSCHAMSKKTQRRLIAKGLAEAEATEVSQLNDIHAND